MVCYHWGSRSPETACVSALASRLGGEFPDSGSTIGTISSGRCHGSCITPVEPPLNVAENNNMTIRRIYVQQSGSLR